MEVTTKAQEWQVEDIFIFLSNDVVISGKFVEQIEGIIDNADGRVLIGGIVRYQDTGWNTIEIHGKPSVVMYPEGWLVACTRDLWKEIGGWDSRYCKFDCEDLDLGAWAIYNDVPLASLNNPNLKHLFGQTVNKYQPDREQYTKKNRQIFLDKWTAKLQEKYE